MKHIDYLYFNIYNYFYRNALFRESSNTRIQTMYLFSLGSGGWVLMLQAMYLPLIKHSRFASRGQSVIFAASIYMLTTLLFNYIFIIKHRDLKIFGKYEEFANQNPKQRRHFIISIGILLLPYLTLLVSAIFLPRHSA